MKLTKFNFFKNTPLIDFQNTIHFKTNKERDDFFLKGRHYPELQVDGMDFNFIRDRGMIDLPVDYDAMRGVNYCTFVSQFENERYYAYVLNYEYLQPGTVRVYLLVDGIMTFTNGLVLENIPNLNVIRQHLPLAKYNENIWELKNNSDILKTHTKSYFKTDKVIFDDLIVLIASSADLTAYFGNVDDPRMETSSGKQFDKITSPLDLYACDLNDFNKLMKKLAPYAWISQNIKSMSLIPRVFMADNLSKVTFTSNASLSGVDYLYHVTGSSTNKNSLLDELFAVSRDMNATMELFGLDPIQEKHLLRNEYMTTELYNYSGGQFFVDMGQLNDPRGLSFWADIITGYHNEMKVYIDNYRNEKNPSSKGGSYVNDSLVFDKFDDIPMLVDSYNLALSKNANQRALAESKLLTNRVENIFNPKADLKDRFMDAASLVSNISLDGLFGRFSDEYEYYRTQKAENADLALEAPTINMQTNGNSFNIANDMFGIHIKYSKPSPSELNKIRKYYKMFGYQMNDHSTRLERTDSMSICNYVQFSGSWSIGNADVGLMEMMRAQFENGVRLWHNNGKANPMNQNVLLNRMVV